MSKLGPCVVLAALWCAACTKPNPDLCCSSEADCEAQGIPADQMCTGGLVCRGNQCIAETCTTGADCDAAAPYCNAGGLCEPTCDTNAACPGFGGDAADALCSTTGQCVACETSLDCTDASLPACVANTCVQCATSADCTDASLPACVANTCVQCATSTDCGSDTPVCDANACRACGSDAECASGVCESTGACADAADVIYVDTTGSDTGTCTQAAPCAHLSYAVTQLQATRNIISIAPGDYADIKSAVPAASPATSIAIYGHGATLTEIATINSSIQPFSTSPLTYFVESSVSASIQDLTLETTLSDFALGITGLSGPNLLTNITVTNSNAGIYLQSTTTASKIYANNLAKLALSTATSLILDRAVIHDCAAGILIQGSIQATNLLVYNITGAPAINSLSSSGTIAFSTVANGNTSDPAGSDASGINCDETSALAVKNSILWTTGPRPPESGCVVSSSIASSPTITGAIDLDPKFVDPVLNDYHLQANSPAIDMATSGPTTDFEGDSRPQGPGYDVGADEHKP